IDLLHNRFGAMPKRVQHLAHTTFIRKAHDYKATLATRCVLQGFRITKESSRAAHGGFVKPGIGEPKHPDFINLVGGYKLEDFVTIKKSLIVDAIRFMRRAAAL